LGRLLLRNLPDHFTEKSVYTFFPLMTPASMKTHLTKLKVLDQYDLERPKAKTPTVHVKDYSQVAEIVKSHTVFGSPYAARAARVIPGKGYVWSFNVSIIGGSLMFETDSTL
jgi:linoleate 10R-lipoxygenase